MTISRRQFIRDTAAIGGLWTLSPNLVFASGSSRAYKGAIPICQGMTNSSSAQFTILNEKSKDLSVRVLDSENQEVPITRLRRVVRPFSPWAVDKYIATELTTSQEYRLQVIEDVSGKILDERNFKSLNLYKPKGYFALVSCANDFYKPQTSVMWSRLETQKPEIIFFIGDTVYADNKKGSTSDHTGGEENFWSRYADTFLELSHYRNKDLVPTIATWDDHDFGVDRGDSTFGDKEITTFLFDLYWGDEEVDGLKKGPGVSKILQYGGQRFFFSDNRSFRLKQYWGSKQEDFLFEQLEEGNQPTWLMDGSQFFGRYRGDEGLEATKWSKDFKSIIERLKKVESPIAFASGDIHYSEIMKIEESLLGYSTYEFTSSSIHSLTFPNQHQYFKNSRRIAATSGHNFVLIKTEVSDDMSLVGDCRCLTNNAVAYSESFEIRRK